MKTLHVRPIALMTTSSATDFSNFIVVLLVMDMLKAEKLVIINSVADLGSFGCSGLGFSFYRFNEGFAILRRA